MHGEICGATAGVCKDVSSMGWFRQDPIYKQVLKLNADEPEMVEATISAGDAGAKADNESETTQTDKSKPKKKSKKKRRKKRKRGRII